jgi:hypothetical protein
MRELSNLARRAICYITLACSAGVFFVLMPGTVCAQKMEQPARTFEAGDKVVYNWVLNNKSQPLEEEWTTVTNDELQGVQRIGGKEFKVAIGRPSLIVREAMCISNGQPCVHSPGLELARFPLEKGAKWAFDYTTKGETFTAQSSQDRRVEVLEKVKVPAGEFEAYKVSFEGRFRGTNNKGNPFSGRFEGSDWFALIGGKLVAVKRAYKSTLGDKATLELVSTSFK